MSRRIPKGFKGAGRFTTAKAFARFVARAEEKRRDASRDAQQARRKAASAKRPARQEAWRARAARAEETAQKWSDALRSVGVQPKPPKKRAPKVARGEVAVPVERHWEVVPEKKLIRPTADRPDADPGDGWTLWEFGVSYEAASKHRNVMFNAQVSREDGGLMTRAEALRVFDHFSRGRELPGYSIRAVEWSRPSWNGATQSGTTKDLASFEAIMAVCIAEKNYRLGAVET